MQHFINELRVKTEQQLRQIENRSPDELSKARQAIGLLEDAFCRLKERIAGYAFLDEADEIAFFKQTKPGLFCNLIYYSKVYNAEMGRPMGSNEAQLAYLQREMCRIKDFFDRNYDFYHYYRQEATHLDKVFFTRGRHDRMHSHCESFWFERDPEFSTDCDYKVAKILANDRFQLYLQTEIDRLVKLPGSFMVGLPKEKPTWTDKKVGLVELLNALEAKGSLNNGNITMRELVGYWECSFNVDLSNANRSFYELCLRENPTRFLDELKEALLRKIEEINGSAPKRKIKGK